MGRLNLVLVLLDSQKEEWYKVVSYYILLGEHPGCKYMYTNDIVRVDLT